MKLWIVNSEEWVVCEWRYTLSSDYRITYDTVDWYNKNHFDYRGIIPMRLANDATGLNIY